MTTTEELPPNSAPYSFPCAKCGKIIYSHTEADLNNPMETEWVRKIARVTVCAACMSVIDARNASLNAQTKDQQWRTFCPAEFRNTEAHRLPSPVKLEKVLAWKYGEKGLLLHGATGAGKSRCAWKLLRREFLRGKRIEALNCDFGLIYGCKFSVGAGTAWEWLEEKAKADILLLDDVFKIKLTESAESALFMIINFRTENQRPIIVTLNDTGATLMERISPDRGPALIRRLKEFCNPIQF